MITILPFLLSLCISITPTTNFLCDNESLSVTIRNNLNGDFQLVNDLEKIDKGAFVVLEWKDLSLMLPVSFKSGEISFTDKKWLWSYKDENLGLHEETPRLAELRPSGKVIEHECKLS